jgi:hypothetical protein
MDMLQRSLEQTKKRAGSAKASADESDEVEEKPKKTTARRKRSAA